MLGFSKSFAIFIFIAVLIGIATREWRNGLVLLAIYAGVKIIWNIMIKK